MHCSHYLDKKGIINETLTFDQPKQTKSKSATLKSKRKVPRPPLGPPPNLNDNVSKYRLEAENILRNKKGNVMNKIKYNCILVDGPPGYIGRDGFLHNLDNFNTNCLIIIDDVNLIIKNK